MIANTVFSHCLFYHWSTILELTPSWTRKFILCEFSFPSLKHTSSNLLLLHRLFLILWIVYSEQHIIRSHERCPTKIAIRSQPGGQADHERKEIWPHHACAQGSTSLASYPLTHHFQNCNLCSKLAPWLCPNISQSILHPHLGNQGQSPPSFCCTKTPYHTSYQDASLRAQKLLCPIIKSRNDTETFQDWIENSPVSWGIYLVALTALMWLTWLRGLNM